MSNELGIFLGNLRKTRGWSLTQAAERAGLSRGTLHRWERGKFQPRLPELEAALTALGVTSQQLRQAIALVDAPRAQARVREDVQRFGQLSGLGPMPGRGDLLRAMRLRQGWTLDDVASQAGVTTRTLRFWENGEVWPVVEKLHHLCILLKAHEQEVIAITCMATPITASAPPAADALEERLANVIDRFDLASDPLIELDFITLAEQAWRLATRKEAGRYLLAHIFSRYAGFLVMRERFVETAQVADRALELLPEKGASEMFWLYAGISAATASVYRGARPTPQRGIEMLRHLLPAARHPAFQAWILADMAKYHLLSGSSASGDAAVQLTEQARQTAREAAPIEHWLRDMDRVRVLIRVQRAAEALDLLEYPSWEVPQYRAVVALLLAEAHLEVSAIPAAQEWLQRANADIQECGDRQYLRSHAEALARRF
jgi:transcriptional regulator with XRE-family HTH domain/S-adenosylmethionine/arginine decarboxylase-like enzyme